MYIMIIFLIIIASIGSAYAVIYGRRAYSAGDVLFVERSIYSVPLISIWLSITLPLLSVNAHAAYTSSCVSTINLSATVGNMSATGPANGPIPGLIGTPYTSPGSPAIFTFTGPACSGSGTSTWGVANQTPIAGITYSSPYGALPVYPTGTSGIGYAMVTADPNSPYQPLVQHPSAPLWNNSSMFTSGNLGGKYILYFVTTGPLVSGTYSIPSQVVGKECLSSSPTTNTMDLCSNITTPVLTITISSKTCTIQTTSLNQSIAMPTVSVTQFKGINSVSSANAPFNTMIDCDAGVMLKATMTDVNNPSNTGTVLTLGSGSSASGVGIQIYYNGASTPLPFGPPSATAGNQNQFLVGGNSGTPQTTYTLPFTAKYVQTAPTITTGIVKAQGSITFSYQ